jgi:hypothetical protein
MTISSEAENHVDSPAKSAKDKTNTQNTSNLATVAQHPVEVAVDRFVKDLDSISGSAPMMLVILQATRSIASKEYNEFIENCCTPIGDDEPRKFSVPREKYSSFGKVDRALDSAVISARIIPRNLVVSLLSQYDVFLARLVSALFEVNPKLVNASSRAMEFSKIATFNTIEEIRLSIVDAEVESLLRKSHHEQFDWLATKFSIALRKDLLVWPEFIELTQRRNLFVHADGVISAQYLQVCREHEVKLAEGLKLGDVRDVDLPYLMRAQEILFEVGVKLSQVLWRSQQPKLAAKADAKLNAICIQLLSNKRYKLAQNLLDFSLASYMKHPDKEAFLYLVINRANAHRLTGDVQACKKHIASEDWSAYSAKYRLAQAVLTDNVPSVVSIMREIGSTGEPDKHQYREWPLFASIEGVREFRSTFEEIFNEPFAVPEIEIRKDPDNSPPIVSVSPSRGQKTNAKALQVFEISQKFGS